MNLRSRTACAGRKLGDKTLTAQSFKDVSRPETATGSLLTRLNDLLAEREQEEVSAADPVLSALDECQAIIELDRLGRVTKANTNFLKLIGRRHTDLVGQSFLQLLWPTYSRSTDYALFWKRLQAGNTATDDIPFACSGGRSIYLRTSLSPIIDQRGRLEKIVGFAFDVTDYQRQTTDLQSKIAAVDKVLARLEFSPQGKILRANANFLKATGFSESEIIGQNHTVLIEESHIKSKAYDEFWQRLRTGEVITGDFERFGKDAQTIWMRGTYSPVFDQLGAIHKIILLATDVTREKQRMAHHTGVVEAIDRAYAVIDFDADGYVTDANDQFVVLLGYDTHEFIGQHHSMFVDSAQVDTDQYLSFWQRLRKGEPQSGTYQRLHRNGEVIWFQATYNPVMDPSGRLMKISCFALDATDHMEDHAQGTMLTEAIEDAQNALLILNDDGKTEYINQAFMELTGLMPEKIIGHDPLSILTGPDTDEAAIARIEDKRKEGVAFQTELLTRTIDDEKLWVSFSLTPTLDETGKPEKSLVILTDLTELKSETHQLASVLAAAEETSLVMDWSAKGELKRANENVLQLFGAEEFEELDVLLPLDKLLTERAKDQLLEQGFLACDVAFKDTSGAVHGASAIFAAVKDHRGIVQKLTMYAMETTQRTRAAGRADDLVEEVLTQLIRIAQEISGTNGRVKRHFGHEAGKPVDLHRAMGEVAREIKQMSERTSQALIKMDGLLKNTRKEIAQTASTRS